MSDLVERLRHAFDSDSVAEKNIALRRAHIIITALQMARDDHFRNAKRLAKRVAALEAEVARLHEVGAGAWVPAEQFVEQRKKLEAVKAENARLREALFVVKRTIKEGQPAISCTIWAHGSPAETLLDHICAALGEGVGG